MRTESVERRYLVFVSSTFEDLKPERERVLAAILERRGFPDGMEIFPAASQQQWEFIKHEISICDFYVVVVGGKYGSLTSDGISYTEKEFDYALSLNKPILAFLHKNPESLPGSYLEHTAARRRKLDNFRKKIKTDRVVKFYTNPDELKAEVVNALSDAFSHKEVQGWVRTEAAATVEGGLSQFREGFRDLSHEPLLLRSSLACIVLNDGRGWIDSNRDLLEARARVAGQITQILVLHPRSPFLKTLVAKNGKLFETQVDEIRRTFRVVEHLRKQFGEGFEIRGHDGFNPYAMFLGDKQAYIMPYYLNEAGQLPVMIFDNNGQESTMYNRYKKDFHTAFINAVKLSEEDFVPLPSEISS